MFAQDVFKYWKSCSAFEKPSFTNHSLKALFCQIFDLEFSWSSFHSFCLLAQWRRTSLHQAFIKNWKSLNFIFPWFNNRQENPSAVHGQHEKRFEAENFLMKFLVSSFIQTCIIDVLSRKRILISLSPFTPVPPQKWNDRRENSLGKSNKTFLSFFGWVVKLL